MVVSGVRSSWLTAETNWLFCRERARSSRARALDGQEREHHDEDQERQQGSLDPREPRGRGPHERPRIHAHELARGDRERSGERAARERVGIVRGHEPRCGLGHDEAREEPRQPRALEVGVVEHHTLEVRAVAIAHRAHEHRDASEAIDAHGRVLDLDRRGARRVVGRSLRLHHGRVLRRRRRDLAA